MIESTSEDYPVCVITGGSSGIGLAAAELFSRRGFRIAICARRPELLKEAKRLITSVAPADVELLSLQVDLADPQAARVFGQSVVDAFGRINVLVNNAGLAPLMPFGDIDDETFENVMNVNMRSVFQLTQVAWKQMLNQGRGLIVNISSLAAVDPFPGFSLYGASKAWMDLLTVALAAEGADKGIRVCSIRPGAVETPMLRGLFPDFPSEQCVSPQDVAAMIWACVNDPDNYESGGAFEMTNQN